MNRLKVNVCRVYNKSLEKLNFIFILSIFIVQFRIVQQTKVFTSISAQEKLYNVFKITFFTSFRDIIVR